MKIIIVLYNFFEKTIGLDMFYSWILTIASTAIIASAIVTIATCTIKKILGK